MTFEAGTLENEFRRKFSDPRGAHLTELPKAYFMEDIPGNIAAGNRIWTGWWGEDTLPGADGTGSALNTFCMCNIEICLDE
ncbi:unnamed protein product [Ectocarpus sp. CCAP 1310/34]|nr:unnamed protein product [Ectocarpus sp. CCAP 1310/34]